MNRAIWVLLAAVVGLWAHGGVLLLHQRAGAYVVSLFSADAPLRAGAQDFTVLVQDGADANPVSDSHVVLSFRGADAAEVQLEARLGQAANKMLYAAPAHLTAGVWRMTISVQAPAGAASAVRGTLTILPEQPPIATYWPYFAAPPVVVLLFVLNRWLRRRSKTATIRSVRAAP